MDKIKEMCAPVMEELERLVGKKGAAKDLELTNVRFDEKRGKVIFSWRNPNDKAALYND